MARWSQRRERLRYICTIGAALAMYASGCSDEPPAPRDLVRDSAGIRIVENHGDIVPAWRLSSTPTVDIGSVTDPLTSLYQVAGAHRLSGGRIVVANRGSNELRFYDAAGDFLHAVGRAGEGPEEYVYIAWTARCGTDTLYVYDIGTQRLTVVAEPYWYVTPWPRPSVSEFPALEGRGRWHVDGWLGAVLLGTSHVAADGAHAQARLAEAFLQSAITGGVALLKHASWC